MEDPNTAFHDLVMSRFAHDSLNTQKTVRNNTVCEAKLNIADILSVAAVKG